jgi:transcriptional regulator with XRE-family HTH domain
MSDHRKWRDIRRTLSPEQEERTARGVAAIELGIYLDEMRQVRGLTQADVAKRLGSSQSHVAQLETRKKDIHLSTLASYIEALGGELRLQAVFPGEEPIAVTVRATATEQEPETAISPA